MDPGEAVRAAATRLLLAIGLAGLFGLIGVCGSRGVERRGVLMLFAVAWGVLLGAGSAQLLPGVHAWLFDDGRSALVEAERLEERARAEVRAIVESGASFVAARERLARLSRQEIAPMRRQARAGKRESLLVERSAAGLLVVSGLALGAWGGVIRGPAWVLIGVGVLLGWMGTRLPEGAWWGWIALGVLSAGVGRLIGRIEPTAGRAQGWIVGGLDRVIGPGLAATLAARCELGAWGDSEWQMLVLGVGVGLCLVRDVMVHPRARARGSLGCHARSAGWMGRGWVGVLASCGGLLWLASEGMAWRAVVLAGVVGGLVGAGLSLVSRWRSESPVGSPAK